MPNGAGRARRWVVALVAVALVGQLAGAVGYLAAGGTRGTGRPAAAAPQRAVRVLLRERAAAICHGRRAAFLATVAPDARGYWTRAALLYDRITRLPLASCRYRLRDLTRSGTVRWTAQAAFDYRLRGFDAAPVSRMTYLTIGRSRGTWRIIGDGRSHRDAPAIWGAAGRLVVVRRGDVLVIGSGRARRALRPIAARTAEAIGRVDAVWHRRWARRAVVEVPASHRLARRLAGTVDTDAPAAVATVLPGPTGPTGPTGQRRPAAQGPAAQVPGAGDRVVVMPRAFARLSTTGTKVVLTHELTHVATRSVTTARTPVWLVEGFADYVGYRRAGLPVRTVAAELAGRVAAGRLPAALPGAAAFHGGHAAAAYEQAWLACRMIARRYGEARLVRLYVAAGRHGPRSAVRRVLGVSPHRLTVAWRDYLRRELA